MKHLLCLLLPLFFVVLCLCPLESTALKRAQADLPAKLPAPANKPDEQPADEVAEKTPVDGNPHASVTLPINLTHHSNAGQLLDSLVRLESKHLNWQEHNHAFHLAAALIEERVQFDRSEIFEMHSHEELSEENVVPFFLNFRGFSFRLVLPVSKLLPHARRMIHLFDKLKLSCAGDSSVVPLVTNPQSHFSTDTPLCSVVLQNHEHSDHAVDRLATFLWLEHTVVYAALNGVVMITDDPPIRELLSRVIPHMMVLSAAEYASSSPSRRSLIVQQNFDALLQEHALDTATVLKLRGEWDQLGKSVVHKDQNCLLTYAWRKVLVYDQKKLLGTYYGSNFGDDIGPILVGKLSHMDVCLSDSNRADQFSPTQRILFSVGSIVALARRNAVIWGSGNLNSDFTLLLADTDEFVGTPLVTESAVFFLGVRGPLTRLQTMMQARQIPPVIGDPALLLGTLFPRETLSSTAPVHDLCLILHYADKKWDQKFPKTMHRVDIEAPFLDFLKRLMTCRRVVSSSLHGVIVAHAYNIPALPVRLGNAVAGHNFKFHDHFRSGGNYELEAIADWEKSGIPDVDKMTKMASEAFPIVDAAQMVPRQLATYPAMDTSLHSHVIFKYLRAPVTGK